MRMDIQQQIAQTGYHHQAHLHITGDITPTQDIALDPLLDIITGTGTDIKGPNLSLTDINVTVKITHITATPDHITDAPKEAHHVTITAALIVIAVTHPTGDHHHIEALLLTPEITVDVEHVPHTNQVRPPLQNLHPVVAGWQWNTRTRNIGETPLMSPSLTTITLMIPQVSLKMMI